jgi:hypothetical protein
MRLVHVHGINVHPVFADCCMDARRLRGSTRARRSARACEDKDELLQRGPGARAAHALRQGPSAQQ